MSTYGTIPTSTSPSPPPPNFEYITRAKHRIQSNLATRRPWREMFSPPSFSFPPSLSDSLSRAKSNLSYFQTNYAILLLSILLITLLWDPFSLIVFLVLMVAWVFLYFMRDEPLVAFNRTISDRTVLVALAVVTVGLLLVTHATGKILGALGLGAVVVLVHAVARKMEYLDLDEEANGFLRAAAAARGPPPPSS